MHGGGGGQGGGCGERRTAFVHGGTRRDAEKGELLFVRGGRGGARRTAYTFFVHGGTRRDTEKGELLLSAEDAEGRGERRTAFCPRRTRRGAENGELLFVRGGRGGARRTANCFLSAEDAEGRGEGRTAFCPRREAENNLGVPAVLCATGGRGGERVHFVRADRFAYRGQRALIFPVMSLLSALLATGKSRQPDSAPRCRLPWNPEAR